MLSLPPITLRLRGWKLIDRVALAFLLLCAPSTTSGVGGRPAQAQANSWRAEQEDNIREAVLQRLMRDWVRDLDKDEAETRNVPDKESAEYYNFKIFFVEVGQKDPSDDFMKRFGNIPRIVKKASEAEIKHQVMRMPVVDKQSGERGIIFRADSIEWRGHSRVKVKGGYHCDGLCGAGYIFDVRFEAGRWTVKKEKMEWVS